MVIKSNHIVDAVLSRYATQLGGDATAYRNHVMRSLNYYALLTEAPVADDAALAWAVHDIGIWTAKTFDYLGPSARLAEELAPEFGIEDSTRAEEFVLGHHRLLPFSDPELDAFRNADLVDFSRGIFRNRLTRHHVNDVVAEFPYAGFHQFLAKGLVGHALHHPLNPLPMVRLRALGGR